MELSDSLKTSTANCKLASEYVEAFDFSSLHNIITEWVHHVLSQSDTKGVQARLSNSSRACCKAASHTHSKHLRQIQM